MARTTHVKKRTVGKNGKRVLSCSTCHKPIEYGSPYKWFKRKSSYGGTVFAYHEGCSIRPSHRTTSRMGEIWDAQEDFVAGDDISEIQANLASFAEVVREVAEGYRESQENIESGFGHSTYQSDELGEKADELESWADDVENTDLDEEEPSEDDLDLDDDATDEEREEALAEKREEWLEAQRDMAVDAVQDCPVG